MTLMGFSFYLHSIVVCDKLVFVHVCTLLFYNKNTYDYIDVFLHKIQKKSSYLSVVSRF